ncbi:MAG: 2-C-methyl-D-erythritol 4-phosphate cytidylyltransferase [Oscillatoriales cyanobacterium]|jgi:2-C-methyl-D-erythritol 4-phosphate cytidylyltransferase|nr:MAG: 2-C-methyl-D-erythritol 4-phosphate cytidylyltransferase [Oscillatoriales cyanobacterium]
MHVLIPAAGAGRRMGHDRNKLLIDLLGLPILAWTLKAVAAADTVTWIGIICQPCDRPDFQAILDQLNLPILIELIHGGETRQASVYNGMKHLPPDAIGVLIHDGARCLATPQLFDRCAAALATCDGLIAAVPVKDTIKVVDADGQVCDTPDRDRLWAAQTPQGFTVDLLKACHEQGRREAWEVTDDAALFERAGKVVQIVEGEETNLKVTTPMDLAIAEFILRQRQTQVAGYSA